MVTSYGRFDSDQDPVQTGELGFGFDSGSSSAVVNQPDVVARQLFEPVPEG
jgi:hypothetical protein